MLNSINSAKFISVNADKPQYPDIYLKRYNSKKLEMPKSDGIASFRRNVTVSDDVVSAVMSVSALGVFELYINNVRVGVTNEDGSTVYDELKPGWTDYRKRVIAYTYDIASYLKKGENTIYAVVSPGWWGGQISFGIYGYKECAFIASAEIETSSGKMQISTDETWEGAYIGPVLFGDIWNGEIYDARISYEDCMASDRWENVKIFEEFAGEISPHAHPAIREKVSLRLSPVSAVCYSGTVDNGSDYGKINAVYKRVGNKCENVKLFGEQTLLLDFGKNMVGHPSIYIKADRGTKINIYYAELLNDSGFESRGNDGPEGSIYMKNYRSALSRTVYYASGAEDGERYFPTHTFYGFRYIEIEADGDVEIGEVKGIVIGSDNREISTFETSDREVNKLFRNILWGQRGNYLSVPTDCPQRDERLGWSGDTQMFSAAAMYNADVQGFFHKWLRDEIDSQQENGAFTDVSPQTIPSYGNAAWGDAGIIVPYNVYLAYNDREILEYCYPSMVRYMNYQESFMPDYYPARYADWLAYEPTAPKYVSLCCFANNTGIMIKAAEILGKTEDADKYRKLFAWIKEEFKNKFTDENGITQKTQTAYLMALRYGLCDGDLYAKTVEQLKAKIIGNGYKLSTGFIGTGILNMTLTQVGLDSLAYSLLLQTENPSWLYSVRQGATTIWERWNSYTKDKGFGEVGMNSFNHYAYGAVCQWMFSRMAGITPDESAPGYSSFIYCPYPDLRSDDEIPEGQNRITFVKASFDSPAGMIRSEWYKTYSGYEYKLSVPSEALAKCRIVADDVASVFVNDIPAEDCAEDIVCENGIAFFTLGEGEYSITVNNK